MAYDMDKAIETGRKTGETNLPLIGTLSDRWWREVLTAAAPYLQQPIAEPTAAELEQISQSFYKVDAASSGVDAAIFAIRELFRRRNNPEPPPDPRVEMLVERLYDVRCETDSTLLEWNFLARNHRISWLVEATAIIAELDKAKEAQHG